MNELNGQAVEHEATTVAVEAPKTEDAPPEPTADALPDVDAWFAQRATMIESLKARRMALLEQIAETERRLHLLGVSDNQERAEVASDEDPSEVDLRLVRAALRDEPLNMPDIAKRARLGLPVVRPIVLSLVAQGEVRRSGRGGTFYSRVR